MISEYMRYDNCLKEVSKSTASNRAPKNEGRAPKRGTNMNGSGTLPSNTELQHHLLLASSPNLVKGMNIPLPCPHCPLMRLS